MNASISLPLLKNSGLVNVVSQPGSPNSPDLLKCSDNWTMADRGEINSLYWLAKKRQKSHALGRKYDGLLPQINFEKSLSKR